MNTRLKLSRRILAVGIAIFLCASLAACAEHAQGDLVGTRWQLLRIETADGSRLEPLPAASITIHFESKRITGLAGCNSYAAVYQQQAGRLLIGEIEKTEQECDADSETLNRMFFSVLNSRPEFILQNGQLVITHSQSVFVFGILPDAGADESAVINALLRQWAAPQETLLILDQTAFNLPGASLADTLQAVQAELRQLESDPAKLTSYTEVLNAFAARNANEVALSNWFEPDWEVTYLPPDSLHDLLESKFQELQTDFPNSSALFVLSRPGFNATGDQALVYLAVLRPGDAGGYYSLMTLHDGQWQSTLSFRLGW